MTLYQKSIGGNSIRGLRIGAQGLARLRQALILLLCVWVVYSLAQLFWLFATPAPLYDAGLPAANLDTPAQNRTSVDINQLTAFNLFGTADSKAATGPVMPVVNEAELNAETTRLDLRLQGIVYTPEQANALAFIVHQNIEQQYRIGDELPGGTRVELARVLLDRVIIVNNGRYEAVWLYDERDRERLNQSPARAPRPNEATLSRGVPPPEVERRVIQQAGAEKIASQYRDRLYREPQSLAGVINIAPAQRDGAMIGYRVSPGRDQAQFQALGLQPGDVVTNINGIELNDPSRAMEAYRLLQQENTASFSVLRGDERLELNLALEAQSEQDQ